GMEMMWGCVKEEFLARLNKGYIRVGKHTPNKPQKYVISYHNRLFMMQLAIVVQLNILKSQIP
ncbi:MAG: hypothetical protein J6D11_03215, partial [Clostridia bacterium]|nr:hypothetical protein [Clostridia bacterium]